MTQPRYKTQRICGKVWKIRHSTHAPAGLLGYCHYDEQAIYIPYDGTTQADMDVCIHEALHAAMPYLDEHAVNQAATDISKMLWRLGWRREE